MNSSLLRSLYKKTDRDEEVFEMKDIVGLQIVRKYSRRKKNTENKRMFIKFYVPSFEEKFVEGGVDMVENKKEKDDGWVLSFSKGSFFQKPTGYYFGKDEKIIFNNLDNTINFKKKKYSLNEFIDLMEKTILETCSLWVD